MHLANEDTPSPKRTQTVAEEKDDLTRLEDLSEYLHEPDPEAEKILSEDSEGQDSNESDEPLEDFLQNSSSPLEEDPPEESFGEEEFSSNENFRKMNFLQMKTFRKMNFLQMKTRKMKRATKIIGM